MNVCVRRLISWLKSRLPVCIPWLMRAVDTFHWIISIHSRAANTTYPPESFSFWSKHETLHRGTLTQRELEKNPNIFDLRPWWSPSCNSIWPPFWTHFQPLKRMRVQMLKNARNHARSSPFLLRHVDFHLTDECLGPPHSPRHTTARSLYTHFHTTTQQGPHWLQWDAANSPPKLPLPFRRSPPKPNTPVPSLTSLTTSNGIWIQSPILPQLTCADRQMGHANVQ